MAEVSSISRWHAKKSKLLIGHLGVFFGDILAKKDKLFGRTKIKALRGTSSFWIVKCVNYELLRLPLARRVKLKSLIVRVPFFFLDLHTGKIQGPKKSYLIETSQNTVSSWNPKKKVTKMKFKHKKSVVKAISAVSLGREPPPDPGKSSLLTFWGSV